MWNPIESRKTALAWIFGWKILDTFSTYKLMPLESTSELNPLINFLNPFIGLGPALTVTIGVAVVIVYFFYYSMPLVVEALAVYLPLVVIANFSIYIHPLINNLIIAASITSFIIYMIYYEISHRWYDYGARETRLFTTASRY